MKNGNKIIFGLTATMGTLCLWAALHINTVAAGAASTLTFDTFSMENGAAVRLVENSNGLRFSAEISRDEYTALTEAGAKFGMIITPNDLIGGDPTKLTPEAVFGASSEETETAVSSIYMVLNATAENLDDDDNIELWGAIVNIKTGNLTRSFVGVAYVALPSAYETVTNSDGTTTERATAYEYHFAPYYDNDMANNTRCMYYVAQRAIESGENVEAMNENYIEVFAPRAEGKLYRYNVVHHYVTADGAETVEEEAQGGALNTTVTAAQKEKEGYYFDSVKSMGKNEGLVYAAGMQILHIYYTADAGKKDINELLTAEGATEEYFGSTLTLDENGRLVSTDAEGSWSGGQTSVVFTAAFIYDLQQQGYTEIVIGKLHSTPAEEIGGFASTQKISMSGYYTNSYTKSSGQIVDDETTGATYITEAITISLEKKLVLGEDGSYYYENGNAADGVSIQVTGYFNLALVGRDWIFDDLTVR